MNKRQSKKLARQHWKKFFSEELTPNVSATPENKAVTGKHKRRGISG